MPTVILQELTKFRRNRKIKLSDSVFSSFTKMYSHKTKQVHENLSILADKEIFSTLPSFKKIQLIRQLVRLIDQRKNSSEAIIASIDGNVLANNLISAISFPSGLHCIQHLLWLYWGNTQQRSLLPKQTIKALQHKSSIIKKSWFNFLQVLSQNSDMKIKQLVKGIFKNGKSLRAFLASQQISLSESEIIGKDIELFKTQCWQTFSNRIQKGSLSSHERFVYWILDWVLPGSYQIIDQNLFAERFRIILQNLNGNESLHKPFFETCDSIFGYPPDWSKWPLIDNKYQKQYDELRGLVRYRYFELLARTVHDLFWKDRLGNDADNRRLKSRTVFWSNYRYSIKDLKIYLPTIERQQLIIRREELDETAGILSDEFLATIRATSYSTPVCIIKFDNLIIVEFFLGVKGDTLIIDNPTVIEKYWNSDDSLEIIIEELRDHAVFSVHHNVLWMPMLAEFLAQVYQINPENWRKFQMPTKYENEGFTGSWLNSRKNMRKYYKEKLCEARDEAIKECGNEQFKVSSMLSMD